MDAVCTAVDGCQRSRVSDSLSIEQDVREKALVTCATHFPVARGVNIKLRVPPHWSKDVAVALLSVKGRRCSRQQFVVRVYVEKYFDSFCTNSCIDFVLR